MVSEAIKPHAFGKASCEKDFQLGYDASGAGRVHHSMVNARARISPLEKCVGCTLGGGTGAQRVFRAQDFSFQRRNPRLELMRGEMRQILAQDDIGLGLLGREFVEIDGHRRASFALRRNLGITRIWRKKVES
jgi:hypothetical protein